RLVWRGYRHGAPAPYLIFGRCAIRLKRAAVGGDAPGIRAARLSRSRPGTRQTDRPFRTRGGAVVPPNVLQMLASTTRPASGAAIGQVILATAGGLVLSFAML